MTDKEKTIPRLAGLRSETSSIRPARCRRNPTVNGAKDHDKQRTTHAETLGPGIKDGDVEPVIAGGVRITEMIPTDGTEEEFEANCALVYAALLLLEALEAQEWAEYDPEASRRKGYWERNKKVASTS
jgi:hypothetical protein